MRLKGTHAFSLAAGDFQYHKNGTRKTHVQSDPFPTPSKPAALLDEWHGPANNGHFSATTPFGHEVFGSQRGNSKAKPLQTKGEKRKQATGWGRSCTILGCPKSYKQIPLPHFDADGHSKPSSSLPPTRASRRVTSIWLRPQEK